MGPSTGAAALPRRRSTRWFSSTSRLSSHRPQRRTQWGVASPRGSSATSGPIYCCGILAHGFARARCSGCGYDFLVAFSCKGRGVCPSCNARRMVETAAHLVDYVLPPLPVRQWVLSVPKRIRPFLHHNPAIASAVLRIFLRAIRTTLRDASPGAGPGARHASIVTAITGAGSQCQAQGSGHRARA